MIPSPWPCPQLISFALKDRARLDLKGVDVFLSQTPSFPAFIAVTRESGVFSIQEQFDGLQ